MLLHLTGCSYWSGTAATRCGCPRPWRIRKETPVGDTGRSWQVYRRIDDGDTYLPVLRAPSLTHAISLVNALSAVANRYTTSGWPSPRGAQENR